MHCEGNTLATGKDVSERAEQGTHTHALIILTMISQLSMAREALSRMTFALTPYTASAKNTLAAMPIVKHRRLSTGAAIMLASTRGVIR